MKSLSESESKQLLADYGIPFVKTVIAPDSAAAVRAADELKLPVVLKGNGATLNHKSERGLV
ncbi:MAG: carboxylate--amine ligase, partial [Deltaproteobacteria bacterium]